jgi:hypothetical protein
LHDVDGEGEDRRAEESSHHFGKTIQHEDRDDADEQERAVPEERAIERLAEPSEFEAYAEVTATAARDIENAIP